MAKGRELKGRIKSVENTRKITRTMEMVATSKMKRAVDRVAAARPYATALARSDRRPVFARTGRAVSAAAAAGTDAEGGARHAADVESRPVRRVQRQPDQGSARAAGGARERRASQVELHVVGKKGIGYFKYVGRAMASQRIDITDKPTAADAASLVDALMARFIAGDLDAVYVTSSKFKSAHLHAADRRRRCCR